MNSPDKYKAKAKAIPYRPRRANLNWVDFLVIGATILTFAMVFVANRPHPARADTLSTSSLIPADQLPSQSSGPGERAGLIKARIGLALAGR